MGNKVPVRRGRKNTNQLPAAEPAVAEPVPAEPVIAQPAVITEPVAAEPVAAEPLPVSPVQEAPPQAVSPQIEVTAPDREPVAMPQTARRISAESESPQGVPQDTMRIPAYLLGEDAGRRNDSRPERPEYPAETETDVRLVRRADRSLTKRERRRLEDERAWKKQAEEEAKEREELLERARRVEEEQIRIREEARRRRESLDAEEMRLMERERDLDAEVEKRVLEREKQNGPKIVLSPRAQRARTATVIWVVATIFALALISILLGIRNDRLRSALETAESAAAASQQVTEVAAQENAQPSEETVTGTVTGERRVYLTFDDGPSDVTVQVLNILKEHDIKATFFVVGRVDEASKAVYRRIVEEGHTLAMHSYTHNYSQIYESLDGFQEDLHRLQNYLYEITGYWCTVYRFPGGSSNSAAKVDMQELIDYLGREHITYYDWNVYGGDDIPPETIVENIRANIGQYEDAMILLHDAADKTETVEALPEVIAYIKGLGNVTFLPIGEDTVLVQHGDTP